MVVAPGLLDVAVLAGGGAVVLGRLLVGGVMGGVVVRVVLVLQLLLEVRLGLCVLDLRGWRRSEV